jgi:archaellum component FlaC
MGRRGAAVTEPTWASTTGERVIRIEDKLDAFIESTAARFEHIDQQLGSIEDRLVDVEDRLGNVEGAAGKILETVKHLSAERENLDTLSRTRMG